MHDQAGRKMRDAHGGVGRVDALAARTASAIHIDAQVAFVDLLGRQEGREDRGV